MFLFLDVNVWVALSDITHQHHIRSLGFIDEQDDDARFVFCRVTQLSFLRLLTTRSLMKARVLSQSSAWAVYDMWRSDDRTVFASEPAGLDTEFRKRSRSASADNKVWTDAYLAAFATTSGFTLVTYDRALARSCEGSILLLG